MQGRRILVAAAVATALAVVPAKAAQAAVSVTVLGDDAAPIALNAAAPTGVRMMDQKVGVTVDQSEGARWKLQVLDPAGTSALLSSPACNATKYTTTDSRIVSFRGNGTYTVQVSFFADADTSCATPAKTASYQFVIASSVALGQPAAPVLLTRAPNSFSTNTQTLDFAGNPGQSGYEIRYAKGAVLGPDGAISGPSEQAYVDSATNKVQLIGLRDPGVYTVVARAKNLDYYSPWSAPVTMRLMEPFDMDRVTAIDSRGPSYKLRGYLRDQWSAGGKVTVSIASGKKGKHFVRKGKAKVNTKGQWTLRFTVRKYGYYRVKYSYSGNANVLKGSVVQTVRIRRIFG